MISKLIYREEDMHEQPFIPLSGRTGTTVCQAGGDSSLLARLSRLILPSLWIPLEGLIDD